MVSTWNCFVVVFCFLFHQVQKPLVLFHQSIRLHIFLMTTTWKSYQILWKWVILWGGQMCRALGPHKPRSEKINLVFITTQFHILRHLLYLKSDHCKAVTLAKHNSIKMHWRSLLYFIFTLELCIPRRCHIFSPECAFANHYPAPLNLSERSPLLYFADHSSSCWLLCSGLIKPYCWIDATRKRWCFCLVVSMGHKRPQLPVAVYSVTRTGLSRWRIQHVAKHRTRIHWVVSVPQL